MSTTEKGGIPPDTPERMWWIAMNKNQLKRLLKRENIDEKLAKTMISAQASRKQRLALSKKLPTDILENNSQIFEMEQKAQDLAQKLLNL